MMFKKMNEVGLMSRKVCKERLVYMCWVVKKTQVGFVVDMGFFLVFV